MLKRAGEDLEGNEIDIGHTGAAQRFYEVSPRITTKTLRYTRG